jgi:hypothetical protein
MCWRSSVMRCAGFTGSAAGTTCSLGILRGSPYMSSAADDLFECRVDSEKIQGKGHCSVLVRVAYDGCLRGVEEALHESVS